MERVRNILQPVVLWIKRIIYQERMIWLEERNTKGHFKGLKVGDKVKFTGEKQRYTIKARSDRFIICTKPFNLKKTCLYTIIDLDRMVRGTNDRVFNPYDYMIQEDIDDCLNDLVSGEIEVSYRNCVPLDIDRWWYYGLYRSGQM